MHVARYALDLVGKVAGSLRDKLAVLILKPFGSERHQANLIREIAQALSNSQSRDIGLCGHR
jgi:hypothetical protein